MTAMITSRAIWMACCISAAALMQPVQAGAESAIVNDVVYAEYGTQQLAGDLYLPVAGRGPHPVVIMLHGGGWSSGKRSDMERHAEKVAAAGFAVFNMSYRLAPEHRFPAQLEDLKRALSWLRVNAYLYQLDADNIGAWGYSACAHLALLLGTVDQPVAGLSHKVQAVVAGASPTDLRQYPESKYVRLLMPETSDDKLFELASPLANVDRGDAPTFMYHGKRDRIVWIENSRQMAGALKAAEVDHQLYETSLGHYLGFIFSQGALDAGIAFLREHLVESTESRG